MIIDPRPWLFRKNPERGGLTTRGKCLPASAPPPINGMGAGVVFERSTDRQRGVHPFPKTPQKLAKNKHMFSSLSLLCFLFFPVISPYWSAWSECPTDVRGRRPVPGDRAFNSHYRWDTCLFCSLTLSSVGQSRNRWFLLARFGGEEGAEQGWATTFGTVGSQALGFSNCKQTHPLPLSFPHPLSRTPRDIKKNNS